MSAVNVLEVIGANAALKGKHDHLISSAVQDLIESNPDVVCLLLPPFGGEISGGDQEG